MCTKCVHFRSNPLNGKRVSDSELHQPLILGITVLPLSSHLGHYRFTPQRKQRSCDLVALRVCDIVMGDSVKDRTVIVQLKTGRPVSCDLKRRDNLALNRRV